MNNLYQSAYILARLSKRTLIRPHIFKAAVQMTQMPIRMVHPRGYNDFYDNWSFKFHEVNFALSGSKTTDAFVFVFKKYGEYMTDFQIAYAFWMIGKNQLERSEEFWSLILPTVKTQLSKLDRNCVKSLYHFIEGASAMTLQDNEFWEIVEQKLVDEGLHRYFRLDQLTEVLNYLANVGRGSDEMLEIIEKTLIKHRKALTPEIIDTARQGFLRINKGSEILFRVLEDPTVELPQLEA